MSWFARRKPKTITGLSATELDSMLNYLADHNVDAWFLNQSPKFQISAHCPWYVDKPIYYSIYFPGYLWSRITKVMGDDEAIERMLTSDNEEA